jgi:hypothetical protein
MINGTSMPDDSSTIKLSKTTKKRLESHGKMGDTYEDVIVKLLDEKEEMKK